MSIVDFNVAYLEYACFPSTLANRKLSRLSTSQVCIFTATNMLDQRSSSSERLRAQVPWRQISGGAEGNEDAMTAIIS